MSALIFCWWPARCARLIFWHAARDAGMRERYFHGGITKMKPQLTYRAAVTGDQAGIVKVFAEVASEVPTAVRPQTEAYIKQFVASGQSWVAVDADGEVVGYALAERHDRETLSLVY